MILAESFDQKTKYLAVAKPEDRERYAAQILKETRDLGVYPASIGALYKALARQELPAMTIPAFNIRGLTYTLARVIWRKVLELDCAAVIFELAPSEIGAGEQSFDEYAAMVSAAACREGYQGPIFLQGDHFSIDSKETVNDVLKMAKEAIACGFYQIDIDGSHLISLDQSSLEAIHLPNAEVTSRMISALRAAQPAGVQLVLGGEVGEIGGENTSLEDLKTFQELLQMRLDPAVRGLDKISAQTGTTHSGIVLKDGSLGRMNVDFDLISQLSRTARQNGSYGLVQHGASTLTMLDLAQLPGAGVIEVHLATQIQNIVFDHPSFPSQLRRSMQERLVLTDKSAEGDRFQGEENLSLAQQFYKARWAAWGIFKMELWAISPTVMAPIEASFGKWVEQVFTALNITQKSSLIREFF